MSQIFTKRILLGTGLGLLFGLLCFAGFSTNPNIPAELAQWQKWSWSNAMMWSTIINRLTLGIVVALAGTITRSLFFNFKISPIIRGAKMGMLISLPLALGALMGTDADLAHKSFWIVFIAGGVIGMIIDLIITKLTGDGKELLS